VQKRREKLPSRESDFSGTDRYALIGFAMGGCRSGVIIIVALACGCINTRDDERACRQDLAEKSDAVASCGQAFSAHATVETADQLVKAYAARGAIDQLFAHNPVGLIGAEIWHYRGIAFLRQGRDDQSIRAFEHALGLRGTDTRGQIRELVALSERYGALGIQGRALAFDARAYELAKQLGNPTVLAHVQVSLATELIEAGDGDSAMRVLEDCIGHLPSDDAMLPTALSLEGNYYQAKGRYLLARQMFMKVAALPDPDAALDANRNLIDVALKVSDLPEAERLVKADTSPGLGHDWLASRVALACGRASDALMLAEHALAQKPEGSLRAALETLRAASLEKLGRDEEAIVQLAAAVEHLEANLDDLGIDELKAFAERDPDYRAPYERLFALYIRSRRLLEAFAVTQRAMGREYLDGLAASPLHDGRDIATLARDAGTRVEALHIFAKSLRSSAFAPVSNPGQVVSTLAHSIVWTYFVAEDRLWLIALDHGDITIDDLGGFGEIRKLVTDVDRFSDSTLAELGKRLAPRARWARITPTSLVHIVVEQPLDRVPFAALTIDGHRWIERAVLAYVPSAAVLSRLIQLPAQVEPPVVLGDPSNNLAGARVEAIETAARHALRPRLGSGATVESVVAARHASVLAMASHADLTPGNAQLQLADGTFSAAQIIDNRIAPSLAILTSCSSARTGLDAWGALAGALLAAGTRNVIAARWSLDDQTTLTLMRRFYEADGLRKPAHALAIAQRDAIARHLPVIAWAGLISLGTGEQTTETSGKVGMK